MTAVWAAPPENITIDGEIAVATIGSKDKPGTVYVTGAGASAGAVLNGSESSLALNDDKSKRRVFFAAGEAIGAIGGNGKDGSLALFPKGTTGGNWGNATINLNGSGSLAVGGPQHDGTISVVNQSGEATILANGANAKITLGGHKHESAVTLFNNSDTATVNLDSSGGGTITGGAIGCVTLVAGAHGKPGLVLANGDCAEDFDVDSEEVEAGTVMVIAQGGKLEASTTAYDKKVAGVVSGAGECRPALRLGSREPSTRGNPSR